VEDCLGKIKILSARNLLHQKFAAICQKTAMSCLQTFPSHDATGQSYSKLGYWRHVRRLQQCSSVNTQQKDQTFNNVRQKLQICHKIPETLGYHTVKTRNLYLTWSWNGTTTWRQDRQMDMQNYH